jgi:hypothetical protein
VFSSPEKGMNTGVVVLRGMDEWVDGCALRMSEEIGLAQKGVGFRRWWRSCETIILPNSASATSLTTTGRHDVPFAPPPQQLIPLSCLLIRFQVSFLLKKFSAFHDVSLMYFIDTRSPAFSCFSSLTCQPSTTYVNLWMLSTAELSPLPSVLLAFANHFLCCCTTSAPFIHSATTYVHI